MLETLYHYEVPTFVAITLFLAFGILTLWMRHRFEKKRMRFEMELDLLKKLHVERYDANKGLSALEVQFSHRVHHVSNDPDDDNCKALRSIRDEMRNFVRNNSVALGSPIIDAVYALTDYGLTAESKEFDWEKFSQLQSQLFNLQEELLRGLPLRL